MNKICYWMVFVFITLIFGCTKGVIRADLPKTFPNVEILMAKLDRTEALAVLNRYLACRESKDYPCEVTGDGIHYTHRAFHQDRERFIDETQHPPRPAWRITTTSWRESGMLYFEKVQKLEVLEESNGSYRLHVHAPERQIILFKSGKDETIAAWLTLCPNIK